MKVVEVTISDEEGRVFASHQLTTRQQQAALRLLLQITDDHGIGFDPRPERRARDLIEDLISACQRAEG